MKRIIFNILVLIASVYCYAEDEKIELRNTDLSQEAVATCQAPILDQKLHDVTLKALQPLFENQFSITLSKESNLTVKFLFSPEGYLQYYQPADNNTKQLVHALNIIAQLYFNDEPVMTLAAGTVLPIPSADILASNEDYYQQMLRIHLNEMFVEIIKAMVQQISAELQANNQ